MNTTREIAIFGGSFDPPTLAHEAIIENCLADERYDEVWVMPSGGRVDKPDMHEDALRMGLLQAVRTGAFGGNPRLQISDFELQLPRPTETYDTFRALEDAYPDTRFWFVYGADSIANMHTWGHGDYLRRRLAILAVPRAGFELPPESDQLRYIETDQPHTAGISSSEVRRRVAAHAGYADMVSSAVAALIARGGLYSETV